MEHVGNTIQRAQHRVDTLWEHLRCRMCATSCIRCMPVFNLVSFSLIQFNLIWLSQNVFPICIQCSAPIRRQNSLVQFSERLFQSTQLECIPFRYPVPCPATDQSSLVQFRLVQASCSEASLVSFCFVQSTRLVQVPCLGVHGLRVYFQLSLGLRRKSVSQFRPLQGFLGFGLLGFRVQFSLGLTRGANQFRPLRRVWGLGFMVQFSLGLRVQFSLGFSLVWGLGFRVQFGFVQFSLV